MQYPFIPGDLCCTTLRTVLRAVRQVYHFINGSLADCTGVAALSPTSVHRPRIVDRMDIDGDK